MVGDEFHNSARLAREITLSVILNPLELESEEFNLHLWEIHSR